MAPLDRSDKTRFCLIVATMQQDRAFRTLKQLILGRLCPTIVLFTWCEAPVYLCRSLTTRSEPQDGSGRHPASRGKERRIGMKSAFSRTPSRRSEPSSDRRPGDEEFAPSTR